jgi:ABC-type nitrate/sulfonate/bicarbonate transport system substrate-binding protein
MIATGKGLVGITSLDSTGAAIQKGLNIVCIGAQYQKNPFCIMSAATKPINTPQDMIGKKIGVQATNNAVWLSFLKANNIDPGKVDKVVVQFDPSPLASGTVDGWFSFSTNEPNLLAVKGVKTHVFLLNDYNYPLVSETYVVKKSNLTAKRDAIKAMLKAEIMGWQKSLADPTLGATLTVNKYGKGQGFTVAEQTLESKSQNELIQSADTKVNGIFTISDQSIANNIKTLGIAGIKITAAQLFDTSLINEVYQENPGLKTVPA